MKTPHVFNHSDYFHTLHSRIHDQLPVYHGYKQRGGGLGSIFRILSNYAIPIIKRYIIPRAKQALLSTTSDIVQGTPIKQSLKKSSKKFLNNVVSDLLPGQQTGSGLRVSQRHILKSHIQNFNFSYL